MPRTHEPRLDELRRIYLTVGECKELGADPHAWRVHMLQVLREVLGAYVAFTGELSPPAEPGLPWRQRILDLGWTAPNERRGYERWAEQNEPEQNPFAHAMFRELAMQFHPAALTRLRRQVLDDRGWYRSSFYREHVGPLLDDSVISMRRLPTGAISMISLIRGSDDSALDERHARIVQLLHDEIDSRVGTDLATFDTVSAETLPPRLREVLLCLLEGESEKQVAAHLGLSRHTVHQHVKRLHRIFRVASRGELLARCRRLHSVLARSVVGPPPDATLSVHQLDH